MTRVGALTQPKQAGALARRLHRADPSMLLWLAMIAVLVFLVASPMVRLVVSSFQEPETGRLPSPKWWLPLLHGLSWPAPRSMMTTSR